MPCCSRRPQERGGRRRMVPMRPLRVRPNRRAALVLLAAGAVLLALVVPATAELVEPDGGGRPASAPSGICGWRDAAPARYDHVVWVLLENHSRPQLVGRPGSRTAEESPYLNSLA